MTRKYTELECATMVKIYEKNPTLETVHELAVKMRKTRMSIITKLSALGVYRRKVYLTKNGELPRKKVEIVQDMADLVGATVEEFDSLILSKKGALIALEGYMKAYVNELKDEIMELEKGYCSCGLNDPSPRDEMLDKLSKDDWVEPN